MIIIIIMTIIIITSIKLLFCVYCISTSNEQQQCFENFDFRSGNDFVFGWEPGSMWTERPNRECMATHKTRTKSVRHARESNSNWTHSTAANADCSATLWGDNTEPAAREGEVCRRSTYMRYVSFIIIYIVTAAAAFYVHDSAQIII